MPETNVSSSLLFVIPFDRRCFGTEGFKKGLLNENNDDALDYVLGEKVKKQSGSTLASNYLVKPKVNSS